ncbi:hypothetical protein SAY86_020496 [Trapa natans]|uniref:Transferring glycosyl group transferase n=1 Tax=Trapa natans TaxID=22666 RepID=A0AAN7LNB8_TRANT|nr:hypothetical protein SAY86_020496 [Trapa natans]
MKVATTTTTTTMMAQKDTEKLLLWDHPIRSPSYGGMAAAAGPMAPSPRSRLMLWLILFVSATYVLYTLKLISTSKACGGIDSPFASSTSASRRLIASSSNSSDYFIGNRTESAGGGPLETHGASERTEIRHVVFGIAASAKLWEQRKNYIKLWFRPEDMRGIVWLDNPVKSGPGDDSSLPLKKISADTSEFPYSNKQGHRSALRISRIVSETFRLGLPDVRWFVMGDDDTVFVTENLLRVLRKYDYRQLYYIGSMSESHLQNIFFSYSMAYGGGGFAISYPLAVALEKMQDGCIRRYPGLYGSDDRIQACMAELGVPLTKELGFHQYDVYGDLFGLLAAHPVTPLVSLHHLDLVEPIFPDVTRVQALQRLAVPMKLDSAGLMQQSICHDKSRKWTVSVSWGFAVQIFRGAFSPREIELPSRTFLNWYKKADYTAYAFNTRPVSRNPCQKPFIFYLSNARLDHEKNQTVSQYARHRVPHPACKWKMANPEDLDYVEVYKPANPNLWDRSPRRNCCRIMSSNKKGSMGVDVGSCREGEISQAR